MNLLIDGNNLAHRCRHVFSLTDGNGEDVSVTYGFLKVMSSLASKFKATSITVCWDAGVPEFRRKMLPEYKANRHLDDDPLEMDNFYRQVDELNLYILPLLGVLSVHQPGAEADDLLYHASRLLQAGDNMVISGDKDMLQAINANTKCYLPGREKVYDAASFEAEYGIALKDYIYWRAIQGDSSDNIAGVVGIGEKTATKLLHQYGDVTAVFNAADGRNPKGKIDGKLGENIRTFGITGLSRNVYVMALYADRVGAKQCLLDAMRYWKPCATSRIKTFLVHKGFVSMLDGSLTSVAKNLTCPAFDPTDHRVPIAYSYGRKPL